MAANPKTLQYMFDHLFLPPKLPQQEDYDALLESSLLSLTIDGLTAWRNCTEPTYHGPAGAAISAIRNMQQAYSVVDGSLNENEVLRLLTQLTEDMAIPLYVREQNAGVLITKVAGRVLFEVFEISPADQAIMATKGRLRRSFPGAAVALEESDFQKRQFQETIAHTLAEMSRHPVEAMQPKVKKSGNVLHEDRDTNHPGMVSELFIGFLRSIGEAVRCPAIAKNMRDDVLWASSRSPWRRSPSWVLVRVALQLGFNRRAPSATHTIYKEAMLIILSRALNITTEQSLSSEVLYAMSAKLTRRLLKVGAAANQNVLLYVQRAMEGAHSKVSERWSAIQKNVSNVGLTELSNLDFVRDSYVDIPELDDHITWMKTRQREQIPSTFEPPSALMVFSSRELPQLPHQFTGHCKTNSIANLEAFESWVALHCQAWALDNRSTACTQLSSLIVSYHNLAEQYYSKNPEALSIMLLTIFEIWIVCDNVAVDLCPLLKRYDPGVPGAILQNLLLPFASQMRRLRHVEQYLVQRSSNAQFLPHQLYHALDSAEGFPVRYFCSSEEMQNMYQKIMVDAQKKREAKQTELCNLKMEHDRLLILAKQMECEYKDIWITYGNNRFSESQHKSNCKKCENENQAASLEININEWPLPPSSTKGKSVVFEKLIPSYLQSWRQTRFYLVMDVVGMQYSKRSSPRWSSNLASDPHLPSGPSCSSRIGLLSQEKPHVVTHRRAQKVATATETSVCLNNGFNYQYFDSSAGQFLEFLEPTEKVLKMCTYHLPIQSQSLQKYLYRPATSPDGPSSNLVLADQSETPTHMSIEETRDLAMLPLGHHIQLYNILIQLAAPSLDFKKQETSIFVSQCLYQAGPPGDTSLRASHAITGNETFATCLLDSLKTAWHRIKENWESSQALGMFAAVTARLLSLTSSKNVQQHCIELLRSLRIGAFAWVELLRDKSHKAVTQDDRVYFKSKSVDVALVCASSFDVEECHLHGILNSESDASIFVQCSITIQEGNPRYSIVSELTLACLYYRFRRLLHRSLPILSHTHSGISDAIQKCWSSYRPRGEWRVVCTHWLVSETEPDSQGVHFQVHYNILSGELLVNGVPLSHPPRQYEDHSMWPVLFGRTPIEVMPTYAAAMEYSAKRQYKGYDIRFGLKMKFSGGSDLLVQASCSDVDYETIPNRLLHGKFPTHFVNGFVYWYNYTNDTLEFRPRETPWDSTQSTWVMTRSSKGWAMKKEGCTAMGMESGTASAIQRILLPLAEKQNIHIIFQSSDRSTLEVELPALRLGFLFTAGESSLRSREIPGMSIDNDQSIGTLTGFANKLVLKDGERRLVLLPEGRVSWTSNNGHIRVTVSKESITQVHPLYVDNVLGRLIDNGNLQGKLFLSYLHALTSYCLPDTLTAKTGVEQALSILNSAAVRSFDRLSQQNVDTLILIANLHPKRHYYPENKKVMQTASWVSNLSFLSHHGGLHKAVSEILDQASQMSLFYPRLDSEKLDIRSHIDTDPFLASRDLIRTSTFRTSGFGAEEHTAIYDETYQARDRDQKSARGHGAFALSSIVYQERKTLHTHAPQGGQLWRIMFNVPEVLGPLQNIHISELQYSAKATNSGLQLALWPALHKVLSTKSHIANKFSIMIWLSALAAHENADIGLLQVLALFFTASELRAIALPPIQSCRPSKGHQATSALLKTIIRSHLVGINSSPESEMQAHLGESRHNFQNRRHRQYTSNQNSAIDTFAKQLLKLWPTEILPTLENVDQTVSNYVKVTKVQSSVRREFQAWFANLRLLEYLQGLEKALSSLEQSPLILRQPGLVTSTCSAMKLRTHPFVSVRDLFSRPAPILPTASLEFELELASFGSEKRTFRLLGLLEGLRRKGAQSRYEASYIDKLKMSMQSLQEQEPISNTTVLNGHTLERLHQHLDDCKKRVNELYIGLLTEYADTPRIFDLGHTAVPKSSMCSPRFSPLLLLQQLRDDAWKFLSRDWRVCLTRYGLALTSLQRAERLLKAASLPSDDDFIKELKNIGHRTWDPLQHPEWLLLEVESGILIRDVQERIASEMINPHSQCNAVLQLNMGEGKSSVIVPMVAAELANKSQLARVIVAKPQSKQMAQMLISKLGGLLNRRVYYMPFSRALKLNSIALANGIDKMLKDCQHSGGVLLVQPEHLLSFQLMGLECYFDQGIDKQHIGESFVRLQDFFDFNSRDIVDESDENFSPKFELVYTMGCQQSIELSPARWLCMQQVLGLVRSIAAEVSEKLPRSIQVESRGEGGFPRLRILKEDAGELLIEKVARRICHTGLDGFPIARQQEHVREAVFRYISQYNLNLEDVRAVEGSGDGEFWTESTKLLLFLIRGILAGGVLTFALSRKRWRVDYGLAADRVPPTKLAVPYRAKDNPTPRSEFSHPDVVIVLTSLTYYYNGLEDEDLFIALGHLMESDQASIEYDTWVKDSHNMPASFRQLEGINLKDRPQCINDVFPCLKYGKSVIDYFLGHIVFPKEVKEFPYKLSASGWDLGKNKAHYTTGFSGTNDSRKALPLDMKHLDLPSQNHTNALVLEHILKPENSVFLLPEEATLHDTDAQRFLDTVVAFEKPTRVILDVGAQILELNNRQVALRWLQMTADSSIQATVFVNDDDELSVIDRKGNVELLQTSSYATRLDTCLVFLDQAHTRGIDLRLPNDYRAAVTLGANLTKDRLVQACMRLRNLGRGQSVVFCVSAEIRDKIRRVTSLPSSAAIEVRDVLHWAISETFSDTERIMPLWAAQGARFLRQEAFWNSAQSDGATRMSSTIVEKFLDDEAQSIEARYRPRFEKATSVADLLGTDTPRLEEIEERWNEFDHLDFKSSTLEEEQERELSPEIEQEREVQRPDPARPAKHYLHPDVISFVDTGSLAPTSSAYMPAFHSLGGTSATGYFRSSQLNSDSKLYVTSDFTQTVDASGIGYVSDSYQRPVQWILSSRAKGRSAVEVLMIISPFEAEQLMPSLQTKKSKKVTLHLYKPRCLTGHRSFDQLDFYSIPTRASPLEIPQALRIELNLFSGQLYFDMYASYLDTCRFLGLAADVTKEGEVVDADGYILRDADGKSKYDKSPVQFLKVLTSKIRRNGQDISKTHVGSMLDGKLLLQSDFKG